MFLHVFSGWDMVLFYGPTVLKETGFEDTTVSFVTTLGLGVVFLVLTIVSLFIVDKIGRRPLAVSGLSVMAGCLGLMAAMTVVPDTMNPASRWALVACLALFVAAFALTLNTVSDVIISEIYPQAIRGPASSVSHTMRSSLFVHLLFRLPFGARVPRVEFDILSFCGLQRRGRVLSLASPPGDKGTKLGADRGLLAFQIGREAIVLHDNLR